MHARYLFIYCFLFPGLAVANTTYNTFNEALHLSCRQHNFKTLECDYRPRTPEPQLSIEASYDGIPLFVEETSYPWNNAITAVLFLIDTSDPARQAIVEIKKQHVEKILHATTSHHRIGLASFDKALRVVVPIGTASPQIISALHTIKAVGTTTELYRNIIKAIDLLEKTDANRKVIFLLSDGLAEDRAYFHEDVINASRRENIIINAIGYPRSVSLSVALQIIRRLSEETGGKYVEVNSNYAMPSAYIKTVFDNIDNGGKIVIQLDKIRPPPSLPDHTLALTFKTDTGDMIIPVPFKTPSTKIIKATASEGVADTVQMITRRNELQPVNLWLWYGIPGALVIFIMLVLLTLLVIWKRDSEPGKSRVNARLKHKPYGYLIRRDKNETCYPIDKTIWRIGRDQDNELLLEDNAVSRKHAELHRNENGGFEIIDLKSTNGIYVNNERVSRHTLHDDDILEIGDICFRFTSFAVDRALEDKTVMQKTRMPITD